MKKIFLIFMFLLSSCYIAEKKKEKFAFNPKYFCLDLQIDPIIKLEKKDLIYIDEKCLSDDIENRRMFYYFRNALKEKGYSLVTNKKDAQVIINVKKNFKTFNYKDTKRVIAEETSIKKKVYVKEKDKFEEEPKIATKYKEVPYEYSKTYLNIEFSFDKIKENKSINIIKTYIEENVPGDFNNLLEKVIYKLVEYISLNEEMRNKLISLH